MLGIDELTRPGASQLFKTLANLTTQQAELATAQTAIANQQAFLSSLTTTSDSKSTTVTTPEPGAPGAYLETFSGTDDPSVSVDVATGRVAVTVSAVGYLDALSGLTNFVGGVYPEIVTESTPVPGSDPGFLTSFEGGSGLTEFGGSFIRYFTVTPGVYTIRLRRGFSYGGASADFEFRTSYRAVVAQVLP